MQRDPKIINNRIHKPNRELTKLISVRENDQYLLANSEWVDIAVSDVPFEESVRIFRHDGEEKRESDE